ncbi:heteromeric transposase endonuclease subunit TnsA [Clostridium scatologenes]|uniref:Transposase protein A n=1 Tax=Clostridium scatologenes TaxID=1548 RepID=A0A0E3JR69_CLOSL|nr:heteromeric transposase endonuclease subunit TnsA [Clostridium scatologenes]AKA71485.1 transposase protein A [Clostridium scatologenes]
MAKRVRKLDINKLIKEGRGTGVGEAYKPWIKIQDVPSLGRRTRLKGIKTGRQHEFLSDMEKNYFYILEYSDLITDIREQYPLLPIEETLTIANELGVEHPKDPRNGENIVMTTDFLITKEFQGETANIARTVKQKDKLMNKRVIEKFEIERIYWKRREIDWGIVTEQEIDKVLAQNISFFHSYYHVDELDSLIDIDEIELEDLVLEYTKRIVDVNSSIRKVSSLFDKDMNLHKGTGISIFKHLLAKKIILINLLEPMDINKKLQFNLSENLLHKEFNIS